MLAKVLWLVGGVTALLIAGVLLLHLARHREQVGEAALAGERPALAAVDHSALDALLKKHVDEQGMVAYRAWKASEQDRKALDDYLAYLGSVDTSSPAPTTAQLAYWINMYNALTIKGILREYPTTSIRNHTPVVGGYNIWRDLLLWVDGKSYSLEDIEHKVLRKMGEPRIHFALVCASKGCPPLLNRAYTTAQLEEQLSANARRFFAQPRNFQVDERSRTVHISELLDWYGTDFAPTPAEQLRVLRPAFPASDTLAWLESGNITVKYLEYDWSLNDQTQPAR